MALGEVGNFLAYGYAPATLVSPLGAVSVIANAILAHVILHEPLLRKNVAGVMLALAGSIVIVISAPTSCERELDAATLMSNMAQPMFICFIIFVVLGSATIIFWVKERLKERYVIFYVTVGGLTLGAC